MGSPPACKRRRDGCADAVAQRLAARLTGVGALRSAALERNGEVATLRSGVSPSFSILPPRLRKSAMSSAIDLWVAGSVLACVGLRAMLLLVGVRESDILCEMEYLRKLLHSCG